MDDACTNRHGQAIDARLAAADDAIAGGFGEVFVDAWVAGGVDFGPRSVLGAEAVLFATGWRGDNVFFHGD